MIAPPACERCGSDNVKLRRYIISNGDVHFRWKCLDCGRLAQKTGQNVSHSKVDELLDHYDKSRSDIPIAEDYSGEAQCEVSGCERPAEVHHVAPRALFGDQCNQWPKVLLCREHHNEWHTTVTPYLNGGHQNATVEKVTYQDD